MYSIGLFQARPSYISGTTRRSTPCRARFLEHVLNDPALTLRGEQYLVNELLASMLEERVERANDIARAGHDARRCSRKLDESFECVPEVANALEVMTQGVCFRSGAHDEYVTGVLSPVESAIKHAAVNESSADSKKSDHAKREQDDATGDVFCANKVERSCQQQARSEANLDA